MNDTHRPNIILITDDEHRCDFYGGGLVKHLETPTFDRLKRMGVTFPNAVTNCPVCMPTRFTWLTGLYNSQSPSGPRNAKNWPVGHPTVAQALQRAGYRTALIGKLHAYHGGHHGGCTIDHATRQAETHARGFDHVFMSCSKPTRDLYDQDLAARGLLELRERRVTATERTKLTADEKLGGDAPPALPVDAHYDDFICGEAIRWLDASTREQPFFLHASFNNPHFPLDPPEPYFSKYKAEDMPKPVGVEDPARIKYWQRKRAVYCGLVEYTDRCIGKLVDAVDAAGLLDNTIILFTSDHGDMMGDHDMYFKLKPFDASIRTPVILVDPHSKRPGGTVLHDMVEAVDLPATLLAAGTDERLQEAMPCAMGRSLLGYARGEQDAHRAWAYAEQGHLCEGSGSWRMIRTPTWKYVYAGKGDMLFNLVDDPLETTNLIDDPAQRSRVYHLRGLLIHRMGGMPIPPASLTCHTDPSDIKSLNTRFYEGIIADEDPEPM